MTSYVITGASRGIGLEWVRQLSSASPSNTVFAVVRNPSSSPQLQELASAHSNVKVVKGDVSSPADMVAAAATVAEIVGENGLDVLVHNAISYPADWTVMFSGPTGLAPGNEDLVARTKSAFDIMWSTTVYGALWVTNSFLPLLEKAAAVKGEAKVVHVSSASADIDFILKSGIFYNVPCAAAKAAMNVITAEYAVELRPKGIKVVSISPGWVETFPGEKPPALLEAEERMLREFRRVDPTLQGKITTEESVSKQRKLLENLDDSILGRMVSQNGDKNWF